MSKILVIMFSLVCLFKDINSYLIYFTGLDYSVLKKANLANWSLAIDYKLFNILIASCSEAHQWCLFGGLERTPAGIFVSIFIPENSISPECQSTSVFPAIFYAFTAQDHSY